MESYRAIYVLVLLLGAWLCISPFVFDHTAPAASNARFAGLALMLFAGIAVIESHHWERWAILVLSGWLVVSPFALHFENDAVATGNAIGLGFIVGAAMLRAIARASYRPGAAIGAPRGKGKRDVMRLE